MRQSFSAEPVAECPECGSKAERRISAVPVVFKGSGWYVNDYGKKGGATAAPTSGDSSDSSSSSDSKTSTDKPSDSSSKKSEPAKASSTSSSSDSKPKSSSKD